MLLPKINPTQTQSWKLLQKKADNLKNKTIKDLFVEDSNRFHALHLKKENILFDFSKNILDKETMDLLCMLAQEVKLPEAMESLQNRKPINETENRKVLHPQLRDFSHKISDKEDETILDIRQKMSTLANDIHSGKCLSCAGEKFTTVINIGTGGSYLGPKFLNESLCLHPKKMDLHFISNVDPQALDSTIQKIDITRTLFIIASKTFSTVETITNANTIKNIFLTQGYSLDELNKNFIAITHEKEKALHWGIPMDKIIDMPTWVGGRYSVWGSIGLAIVMGYGNDIFNKILEGGNKMDKHFFESPFSQNLPVLLAVIGIWNINFLGIHNKAIIPYDNLMLYFPSYLQQMVMESNGKEIDRNGEKIGYCTSPIYWGEVGTDAQHSFFQQLHQGTVKSVVEFLLPKFSTVDNEKQHKILQYNCLAQSSAFAFGKSFNEKESIRVANGIPLSKYKNVEGNVPSNMIIYDKLTPIMLGKLIALYEHQTFVQGVIWNIFSFDQWGVELGKEIAIELKEGTYHNAYDSSTKELVKYLDLH